MRSPLSETYPTAWITGGSSGLGLALAKALSQEGIQVVATSRNPDGCPILPGVRFARLDFEDGPGTATDFVRRMEKEGCEPPDLLINNAGSGAFGRLANLPEEAIRAQLEVMLTGPACLCREVFPILVARGRGCIVNVSSLAVDYPLPFMHPYNTAKAGLSGLSESLRWEARGSGVKIIDLRPGDLRTRFNEVTRRHDSPDDTRLQKTWNSLDAHLQAAPDPNRAAQTLLRLLRRGAEGTHTTGSFFQAKLGMWAIRLFGKRWIQPFLSLYYR